MLTGKEDDCKVEWNAFRAAIADIRYECGIREWRRFLGSLVRDGVIAAEVQAMRRTLARVQAALGGENRKKLPEFPVALVAFGRAPNQLPEMLVGV
jgi:hypothetical protein